MDAGEEVEAGAAGAEDEAAAAAAAAAADEAAYAHDPYAAGAGEADAYGAGEELAAEQAPLAAGGSHKGRKGAASEVKSSRYRGVCLEPKTRKWRAEVQCGKRKESLGYHLSELAAAQAYDRAQFVLRRTTAGQDTLNFPESTYAAERAALEAQSFDEFQASLGVRARRGTVSTSAFQGVRRHTRDKKEGRTVKWRAELTKDGKKLNLGYHETEECAARVYDLALVVFKGQSRAKTNFADGLAQRTAATLPPDATVTHVLDAAMKSFVPGPHDEDGAYLPMAEPMAAAAAAAAAAGGAGGADLDFGGGTLAAEEDGAGGGADADAQGGARYGAADDGGEGAALP